MSIRTTVAIVAIVIFLAAAPAGAREPSWSSQIVARGAMRAQIESTDILHRPYRPLHFYGNTIRRRYYRGRALATVPDVVRATAAFSMRR